MSANQWYYQVAGEAIGPFTAQELVQFSKIGKVDQFTPVRRGDAGEWIAAGEVKGLNFNATQPTPIIPRPRPSPVEATPKFIKSDDQKSMLPAQAAKFDHILFGWTRIVSYVLIAILVLTGLYYGLNFGLALLPPEPVVQVTLEEVRPNEASPAESPETPDYRVRALHGTPISETLQKYFNGSDSLATTYTSMTSGMDSRSDEMLVKMMEECAKELEQSDLKPRARHESLERLIYRQSDEVHNFNLRLAAQEAVRTDAVTKLLFIIGLSVMVSLVIVLLGIESNTRALKR